MNAVPQSAADPTPLRLAMHAAGYHPVPVLRHDAAAAGAGKRPTMPAWQTICAAAGESEIRSWGATQRQCTNTGILCGQVVGLDLDLLDPELAGQVERLADAMLPATPLVRIGKAPKSLRVFRAFGEHRKDATPALFLPNGLKVQVEALGSGNHFVAFGIHPDTRQPYIWPGQSPLDVPFADLPVLTDAALRGFLAAAEAVMRAAGGRTEKELKAAEKAAQKPSAASPKKSAAERGNHPPATRAEVESALSYVPNCHDWHGWMKIGAAIFDALGDAGEDLFVNWSSQNAKDDPAATKAKWVSYRTSPTETTVGTLFYEARQNGWKSERGARGPEHGEPAGDWTGEPVPLPEDTGPGAGRQSPPPDPKRPLFRPLPPPPVFPVHALGLLRPAAEAVQARTQAPMAICAQSVLAAATLAVQAHRDVELPGGGRRPLTGIFASVAESGERKTSVDRIALAPVYKIEEQWRQDHEAERASYGNDIDAWKAARESAKKKNKGDRAAIRAALEAIGSEPKAPPQPMLLVADPTPEALVLHLRDSRPWCGVFTAEGGILIGGSAFNDESRMRTGALFNTLWDGEPIRRSRVLTGNAFLPGRRCSAHVMMQAAVADKLLGDSMLDGIGLLARVLVVAPESTAGSRMFRETPPWCAPALRSYSDRLMSLLTRQPTVAAGAADVLDPPAMTLTAEARALWVQFHDAAEGRLGDAGELACIRAFGAKMGEHAGRLAAVLTVYADLDAMEVNAEAMACGIALAQHYAAEMLRLQGGSTVDPDLRLAARLLAWWQARPDPRCHLAAIYQRGLNAIGDAATARRIVTALEDHGWVRRLSVGTELDGAPRRDAWELVP